MKNLSRYILTVYILFFSQTLFSQSDFNYKTSTNYMQGFIIPEFDLLDSINQGLYNGVEISLFKNSKQKNFWQQLYNHPEYGVSLFYTNFGEDKVLGSSIGLEYFFKINIINHSKIKFYMRSGFGFNYINRKYDEIDNPLNTSMGSNYNVRFNLRAAASINILKRLAFNVGAGLDHFSNANTQYPNRGINAIAFYGGLTYNLSNEFPKYEVLEVPDIENRFESVSSLYLGLLHTKWPDNTYYPVPSLSYDLNYKVGRIFNVGIGADAFYDSSVNERYENANPFSSGLHLAQTIKYNKFSFTLQEGFYLYSDEALGKNAMYNRVVFKWMLTERLGIMASTLSYLNDLELVATGLSYRIK
ncbi:MAG: acyloxyacyl hydrolase [Vicingaceae bacterium]|nr:acyloxyacyl hydrolase [Vicingaceae bacterium]